LVQTSAECNSVMRLFTRPGLAQEDLSVVVALGRGVAGGYLGAVANLPAGGIVPGQGGLFDDGCLLQAGRRFST
jgi:hypothetical protein